MKKTFDNYKLDDIITLIIDNFSCLSKTIKIDIYTNLLITNNIPDCIANKIIKKIYSYGYDKEQFDFINIFNNFIKTNKDVDIFNSFYEKLKELINTEYEIIIPETLTIYEKFNYYLEYTKNLEDNEDYILYLIVFVHGSDQSSRDWQGRGPFLL